MCDFIKYVSGIPDMYTEHTHTHTHNIFIFSPSQHLQPLILSMFWFDEPTTHVGSTLHTTKHRRQSWCVCVFVYIRGSGEMFLAEVQSGMRRLSLPRTSLTLFCLFLAAGAPRENGCVVFLFARWLRSYEGPSSSALTASTSLRAVQGSGVTLPPGSSAGRVARRQKSGICGLQKNIYL